VVPSVAADLDLNRVDLSNPDVFAAGQRHELFARMRAEAPVRWNPGASLARLQLRVLFSVSLPVRYTSAGCD
jgi:hypothetical protein